MEGGLVVLLILVVFAVVVVAKSVVTVDQGSEVMLERFGKYVATLRPGLQFVAPFVYRVGRRMNMMEHAIEIPSQEVITKDNATVTVDAIVFLVIVDAYKAAYNVSNYVSTCQQLTLANVRSVIGLREFDTVLAERIKMNDEILHELDAACQTWGIKVTRVEIRDIRPPADLLAAMGEQKKADQEKRAKILTAEGDQQSARPPSWKARASWRPPATRPRASRCWPPPRPTPPSRWPRPSRATAKPR